MSSQLFILYIKRDNKFNLTANKKSQVAPVNAMKSDKGEEM